MDTDQVVTQLTARIARLERTLGAVTLVAVLPWIFSAAQPRPVPGIVQARELQLLAGDSVKVTLRPLLRRDSAGIVQGVGVFNSAGDQDFTVYSTPAGGEARVYGRKGGIAAALRATVGGGALNLHGADSANRVLMSATARDTVGGGVYVYNLAGKRVGSLYANTRASGGMIVGTATGTIAAEIFARADSSGELHVNNGAGTMMFGAYSASARGGTLQLRNAQSTPVMWMYSDSTSRGRLEVDNAEGKLAAAVTSRPNGGEITIVNNAFKYVALMGTRNDGGGIFSAFNEQGNSAAGLYSVAGRGGYLQLDDGASAKFAALGYQNGGPYMYLFSNGQVVTAMFARPSGLGEVQVRNPANGQLVGTLYGGDASGRLQLYTLNGDVLHSIP